ncbi:hypothetical protein GCM10012275_41700 [Longimycelium tulufanense]|uniref:DUF1707 domain-containing protein n=1 Tax=Longimycelium tulufanense TaxID=907463 RepID=A0A8J3CED4_9PSEU|nr:DUF1707 domain-containing protein [Longimycelium tulufanense]GGM66898.1 hypothetical protein GCM10012275_41700 [Longimycelium tulufanense]
MTSVEPVSPRDLRVSDAEREHVVGLLQRATGRGLLDLAEFSRRTDAALASRTRAELNSVLIDIPGLVNREAEIRDTAVVQQTASSVERRGRWRVPRRVVVRNRWGTSVLDFSEAVIPHPVVTVEVANTAGTDKLVLPPNATVDASDLRLVAASVKNHVSVGGRTGVPHFIVRGSVKAGSLVISRRGDHRTLFRLGRLRVQFPFRIVQD